MDNTSSEARIGDYRLLSKIGEGKSGVVHLATPVVAKPFAAPGQPVALKIYRPEILREPNQVERIKTEAQVGQEITHPNVARIYEHYILPKQAGSKDIDSAFLVMEYVDGITLHAWLSIFHQVSDRLLLRIFRQLVDGVKALHDGAVIHRDIKPTNIIVSSSFQAKITDFGVVKIKDARPGGSTPEDQFLGTIRNASPELLFGEKLDHLTDLYSLGTVLFALLHGEEIFAEETQFARLINLKRNEDPKFDPAIADKPVRGKLAALAQRLLSRDPKNRPQSAEAVRKQIDEIQAELPKAGEPEPLHGYIATALTGLDREAHDAISFASHAIATSCKAYELYVYQPRLASDPVLNADVSPDEVYRLDRARVVAADVLFVVANRPSFGAGQELEIASSYGKPTILIARDDIKISRMTKGSYANFIGEISYFSPEDLNRKLAKLLSGNIDRLRSLKLGSARPSLQLGDQLSAARNASEYSLEDAAVKAGISETLLNAIERGQNDNPGVVVIERLCRLYGIPMQNLMKSGALLAKPVGTDRNVRRLESVARRLGWSAADLLELRDEAAAELAASGARRDVSEEEWEQRHAASQKRKLKEATPQTKLKGI